MHPSEIITIALSNNGNAACDSVFSSTISQSTAAARDNNGDNYDENFCCTLLPSGEPRAILFNALTNQLYQTNNKSNAGEILPETTWTGAMQTIIKSPTSSPTLTDQNLYPCKYHSNSNLPLSNSLLLHTCSYVDGLEMDRQTRDGFEEKLRFYLESCSYGVGGFHIYSKIDCGFGGICENLCTIMKDEVGSNKPILLGAFQDDSRSLSLSLAMARLYPLTTLTIPLLAARGIKSFQALDLCTLPHRLKVSMDMRQTYASLLGNTINLASAVVNNVNCSPSPFHNPPLYVRGRVCVATSTSKSEKLMQNLFALTDSMPKPDRDSFMIAVQSPLAFTDQYATLQADDGSAAYLSLGVSEIKRRSLLDTAKFHHGPFFEKEDWNEALEVLEHARSQF